MRTKLRGLGKIEGEDYLIDSAGTISNWHGSAPDPRTLNVLSRNGIDASEQVSRPLVQADGEKFDMLICMDSANISDVKKIISPNYHGKIRLFDTLEVEDPYHHDGGFEKMYAQLDQAADVLLAELY